jgi:putative ABC transport system permease protein
MKGNMFRTLLAFLCVFGVSAFLMSAMIISRGTQDSMQKGLQRLGADILVVPYGAQTDIETALLMGKPSQIWMNEDYLQTVAAINGVAAVSPQIYLQSLYQAACCSVSETFLVVYDPATDFTVTPWLQQNLGRGLKTGEVIGGADIFSPDGDGTIKLYGSNLKLVGNLNATGTGMDQTIFFTLDTADAISLASRTNAQSPLVIPQGEIS